MKKAGIAGENLGVINDDLMANLCLVDKLEQMLGSYGPHPNGEAYSKNFDPEESPSGTIARMGSYSVKSRVVDDDGEIYAGMSPESRKPIAEFLTCWTDWEWYFKLAKEW